MLVWLRPRPIGILSIEPLRQAGSLSSSKSQVRNILLISLLDVCAADEYSANRERTGYSVE
jgi:hypothetical protein